MLMNDTMAQGNSELRFSKPTFTAVITCYNYEKYVVDAMKSVINQNYSNIECIIVDDCSKDNSCAVIENFMEQHGQCELTLLKCTSNIGQLAAMKKGLAAARGQFVGFLDADDIWSSDFVAAHVSAHLNPSFAAGMSCSDMIIFSSGNVLLQGTWLQMRKLRAVATPEPGLLESKKTMKGMLDGGFPAYDPQVSKMWLLDQGDKADWFFSPTSACVFRRDLLNILMPDMPEGQRYFADYYLNLQASLFTGCLMIDAPLSAYRVHGENGFSQHPVVGGFHYRPGRWNDKIRRANNKRIERHIRQKFDRYSEIFGPQKTASVLNGLSPGRFNLKRLDTAWRQASFLIRQKP
jgi:glycosyltransferase involved in cell wall biosynthesis